MVGAPFARLLANLVVMGGGVLGRAFVDAYKQALSAHFAILEPAHLSRLVCSIFYSLCADHGMTCAKQQIMAEPLQQQTPQKLV